MARGSSDWLAGAATMPRVEGERIRLRAVAPSDRDAVFGVFSDTRAMRYWSRLPMREPREADEYVAECAELFEHREVMNWAIARRDDDLLIGTCTLLVINLEHRRCELGYALGPTHWGQGLAREATTLAIRFAFDELALERIEVDIDPRNDASIALAERLGFRREGLLRARWRVGAEIQDAALFGLLREEFTPTR